MVLADSHCHLNLLDINSPDNAVDKIISRAQNDGVSYFLNVCVSIADFPDLLRTAQAYANVWASVGLHPNDKEEEIDTETLVKLAQDSKVVAIGETGLDYFRSTGDLTWQQERFRRHIQAAKLTNKPLIIHTRNAKEDTLHIMQQEKAGEIGGVMHCFSEDWPTAKKALEMGFYISFSGIVTFKNAIPLKEVAKQVPLDRILIETDSPYLAPDPKRGKPNEPSYLRHTAEYMANLRGISLNQFAEQTTNNFFQLFKGAVRPHV